MRKIIISCTLLAVSLIVFGENGTPNTCTKNHYTLFKMSRNSNRLALFQTISSTFKVKKTNLNGIYTTKNEIIDYLGNADIKVKNSMIYTLNPTSGCKAILEFDANNNLTYIAVKDCN